MISPNRNPASTASELDCAPFCAPEHMPSEPIAHELDRELDCEPTAHDQPDSRQDDTPPWNQIPAFFEQADHLRVEHQSENHVEKQPAHTGHENSDSSQDSNHDHTPPPNRVPALFKRRDRLPIEKQSQRELASNGVRALGDDRGRRRQPALRPGFALAAPADDDLKWPLVERVAILFMIVLGFASIIVLVASYEGSDSAAPPQPSVAAHNSALASAKFSGNGSTIADGSAPYSLRQASPGEMPTGDERPARSLEHQPMPSAPPANGTLSRSAVPQSAGPSRNDTAMLVDKDAMIRLIKRGNDFLKEGDFATARLLFKRAADAGAAEAALALASTYDPSVIKQLGAVTVKPDIDSALKWYGAAADLGSAEAVDRFGDLLRARQAQPQR
jgi:hypothetical protein